MPANQPAALTDPGVECLWDLLQVAAESETRWRTDHQEASRCSYRASWDIWITCPGSRHDGVGPTPGTWGRCTPTVLARHTGDDDNHLAYRGACLGCGWVSQRVHLLWHGGENAGAENANDHTHPGWRDLPVIDRPPHNHGGAAHTKALAGWRKRWEPLLPAAWLDQGGPIRTQRAQPATRHVPGGAPGGGYDMSAGPGAPERPGGQLGLF